MQFHADEGSHASADTIAATAPSLFGVKIQVNLVVVAACRLRSLLCVGLVSGTVIRPWRQDLGATLYEAEYRLRLSAGACFGFEITYRNAGWGWRRQLTSLVFAQAR